MADYKSSNTDTIVKIILVFFISLLSFSIGTFVGKKFSDNQHKLATLEPDKGEDKHSSANVSESNHGTAEETLSDDQVAALANEFVEDENSPPSKTEANHGGGHEVKAESQVPEHETKPEKADRHAAAVPEESTSHQSSKKPESSKAEAKVEPKVETPHADVPSKNEEVAKIPTDYAKEKAALGGSKFTIQIASYPSETEAQKKTDELKKLNFEAFYTPATIKGQTWFRVNVGTYTTAREAQDHKNDLVEKTHISSAIIQKVVQ
jgi:cell division septation protein DedD